MKIKHNMGTLDRVLRFLIGFLVVILYFTNTVSGITAIILMVFASVFVVTSFISFCPLYLPFNITTKQKN